MSAVIAVENSPPSPTTDFRRLTIALKNALEGYGTARPASGLELVRLHARLSVLEAALIPGPLARIRLAVAFLLSNWYPGRAMERTRAQAILDNYAAVLEPLPAWSVQSGCLELVRGQVKGVNPDFPPSAARVYATARDLVTPWRAEEQVILAIIRATHYERVRRLRETR